MAARKKACSRNYVREKIRKIFEAAQEQFRHQKLIEKCRKLHRKCDDDLFLEEFTDSMRYVLVYQDKVPVDNILSFISKYTALFYSISDDDSNQDSSVECSPFVSAILGLLFKSHGASSTDARLHCMQLLSKILSNVPENALIGDEIWQKLRDTVLSRLQDKNSAVRAQTVLAARMLQDPKNPNCDVIKALIFHFNDPNPQVRRAVVSSIALNKSTISHVLARTRDVNDNVRRNAYLVFSKIKAMNLTIKFRVTILNRGLEDRSEMVQKCVEQIVIVNWLENFNRDLLKFLESLDVVNCSEIAIKTVKAVLKTQPLEGILKQLPLDEETHLIPLEKMTPEAVLLWRCLAQHFLKEGNDDNLEAILPSLTILCEHIRAFYKLEENASTDLSEEEQWTEVKEKEILMHLFQLIKVFDLSDEMGRSKLKQLIIDMLISPRIQNAQIKYLIELLFAIIPTQDAFIETTTELISEIRQPMRTIVSDLPQKDRMELYLKISDLKVDLNELREKEYEAVSSKNYVAAESLKSEIEAKEKELRELTEQPTTLTQEVCEEKNDPFTLCKCLSILVEMMRTSKVKVLTPNLLNLKENFLIDCLKSRDLLTQSLATEACAQFCVLDGEYAKENLIRFFLMIYEEGENEINIPTLKGAFDIIQTHGLKCFEHLSQNQGNESEEKLGKKYRMMIMEDSSCQNDSLLYQEPDEFFNEVQCLKNLSALLYLKTNDSLKTIAYEGLCKLLLCGVVYSPSILSRIIIKGFSPIIDCEYEDFIRQTFMAFFPIFAAKTPRSQEMIEAAFVPTMKTILNAPLGSPEADINLKDVAAFLIDHTKCDINKVTAKTLHVHNNLALSLCHEIYVYLCEKWDHNCPLIPVYFKALTLLEISLESESFVQQVKTLLVKFEKEVGEASWIRCLNNFKKKIDKLRPCSVVSSVENTLMTTRASRPTLPDNTTASESAGARTIMKRSMSSKLTASFENLSTCEDEGFRSPSQTKRRVVVPESPEMSD